MTGPRTNDRTASANRPLVAAAVGVAVVIAGLVVLPPVLGSDDGLPLRPEFVRAAESGERAELVADRTETDTLWANPDGSVTRESSLVPTRVNVAGKWRDVDYDLVRTASSVRPKAAPDDVRLSTGGNDVLVRTTLDGVELTTRWVGELPKPRLEGASAFYGDVFPDVDLVVTPGPAGVSQVLVVRTPEAAADPALRKLVLPTTTDGGSVGPADGGMRVLDDAGREVGRAPAPVMWDSSGTDAKAKSTVTGPAPARVLGPLAGDKVAKVAMTVRDGKVSLSPDRTMLAAGAERFPLYVDPQVAPARDSWAMIRKESASTEYYNPTAGSHLRIGFDNLYTQRLFFKFNINSELYGVKVHKATFATRLVGSPPGCTPSKVSVRRTGAISSSTNWSNQPSAIGLVLDERNIAVGPTCNKFGKTLEFDVRDAVQAVSNSSISTLSLMLKADSETNTDGLKQFDNKATLAVTYSAEPGQATELKLSDPSATCATQPSGAVSIGGVSPRVQATLSDVDTDNLRVQFEGYTGGAYTDATKRVWTEDYAPGAAPTAVPTPEGGGALATSSGQVFVSATRFTNNGQPLADGFYTFRARGVKADDGDNVGPWSAPCVFKVTRATVPVPVLSGTGGTWRTDDPTTVTVKPVASGTVPANVASYRWSLNSTTPQSTAPIDASNTTKEVQLSVTPVRSGPNVLRVWAYDTAGNRSVAAKADFNAAADAGPYQARWLLDTQTAGQSPAQGTAPALGVAASQLVERGTYDDNGTPGTDKSLALDGSQAAPVLSAGTVTGLDTSKAFTVSAWLRPGTTSQMVAVSQYAGSSSTFTLGTTPGCGGSCFRLGVRTGSALSYVTATRPSPTKLTHVVATVSGSGTARLYVFADGRIDVYTQSLGTHAASTSPLVVGAAGTAGAWTDKWSGTVDNVTLAQGAYDYAAVTQLHGDDDSRCFTTRTPSIDGGPTPCAP